MDGTGITVPVALAAKVNSNVLKFEDIRILYKSLCNYTYFLAEINISLRKGGAITLFLF
jgi:hypothetical protein